MTPITNLLPLLAFLAIFVNASPDPRPDQLDDMKAQTQQYAKDLKADLADQFESHRRSLEGEYSIGSKEDPSYCGPAGSPVSSRPTHISFSSRISSTAMFFNPTRLSLLTTTNTMKPLSKLATGPETPNSAVKTERKDGSGTMDLKKTTRIPSKPEIGLVTPSLVVATGQKAGSVKTDLRNSRCWVNMVRIWVMGRI
jgi:hypothetical protein